MLAPYRKHSVYLSKRVRAPPTSAFSPPTTHSSASQDNQLTTGERCARLPRPRRRQERQLVSSPCSSIATQRSRRFRRAVECWSAARGSSVRWIGRRCCQAGASFPFPSSNWTDRHAVFSFFGFFECRRVWIWPVLFWVRRERGGGRRGTCWCGGGTGAPSGSCLSSFAKL